jgi:hypothetical protein
LIFVALQRFRAGELLRVQEYENDSHQTMWVAWSPTGEGARFTTVLDGAPGRLLDAQHMPLDSGEVSIQSAPRLIAPGRVEVDIDESPEFLTFGQ